MKPVEILEWTMGWPAPIIIVLWSLMGWGIWRLMNWDEQGTEEQSSGLNQNEQCSCMCDVR